MHTTEPLLTILEEHSKRERSRQTRRALLVVFVVIPSVVVGLILIAKFDRVIEIAQHLLGA